MKRIKIALLLMLALLCGLLAGCGNTTSETPEQMKVFRFHNTQVYLNEVWIYAQTVIDSYESTYGKEVFSVTVEGEEEGQTKTMEQVVREDVINDIVSVKLLCEHAEDYNLSLSEDEVNEAKEKAEAFVSLLTDEQIEQTGIDAATAEMVYEENALADKVYRAVMAESGIEVSYEEARMTTFYDIYFPIYNESENGDVKKLSADAIALEEKNAKQARAWLADPEAPMQPADMDGRFDLVQVKARTMTYEDVIAEYGEKMTEDIYDMKDGSVSEVITSSYGYHVICMVALTDEEATELHKASIQQEKEKAYYQTIFQSWLRKVDKSFSYNRRVKKKVYALIPFGDGEE